MNANELPRLLRSGRSGRLTYSEFETVYARKGSLGPWAELQASGLTGRGGAGFETARKVDLIRSQHGHKRVMVVNCMEGEPASHKDRTLASMNPHLIIDGGLTLGALIHAQKLIICVARDSTSTVESFAAALNERRTSPIEIELKTPPGRYVAGEESALIHWLNDFESLPQYRAKRPYVPHIGRSVAMVDNAETCANVSLITRFGAAWFRSLGTTTSPGSQIVSVTGAVERPVVLEVSLGTALRTILEAAKADLNPQAVLLGGYGGAFISGRDLDVRYDSESVKAIGSTIGPGIIVVFPKDCCGLAETHRIVSWMANESARQCGPCAFGLPALRDDLYQLTYGTSMAPMALEQLRQRFTTIAGRGACKHPDGVIRLVESALTVFREDVESHAMGRSCGHERKRERFATVPRLENESELEWE